MLPSHELAAFLALELAAVVPAPVLVRADGADVVVVDDDESRNGTASILDEQDGRSLPDRVVTATHAVLSHVQDAVVLARGEPWPGEGTTLPLPGAEVREGRLRAWFGERESPVLLFEELDLDAGP